MSGNNGLVDYTVYAKIRFPFAAAPAYANSQSFMNWGDCDHTGRVPSGVHTKDAPYHCRVNDKPLVFDESKNYTYPWQDNFCEHRWFFVSQCPSGMGHQGQDVRPGDCHMRNEGADRCDPYLHDVVAVRDGMVLRNAKQEALILFVDAPGEHLRIRYLHMSPKLMDQDEMLSGRVLREGDVIGKVGNFDRRENGTTYHLHFDVQVPTRDGWVFINPYSMLVTAYERLIGGRGTELKQELPVTIDGTQSEARLDGLASGGLDGRQGAAIPIASKAEVETNHARRRIFHHDKAHASARHCIRKCRHS
jgi:murein DD-endopeptidase MepM/ murein hydrolase activator NlpD